MRWMFGVLAVLAGCAGTTTKGDSGGGGGGACELADASQTCPSCTDGPTQCSYDGVVVTTGSCGDCQARAELFAALCEAGIPDAAEDIEAGTVCVPVTCAWTYPTCSCTAECGPVVSGASDAAPTATSSTTCGTCTDPVPPVGACAWDGGGCSVTPTSTSTP